MKVFYSIVMDSVEYSAFNQILSKALVESANDVDLKQVKKLLDRAKKVSEDDKK